MTTIYIEGYLTELGKLFPAAALLSGEFESFHVAVQFLKSLPENRGQVRRDASGVWRYRGRRIFDNLGDASAATAELLGDNG